MPSRFSMIAIIGFVTIGFVGAQETAKADETGRTGRLVRAARELAAKKTDYDPRYISLEYPGGDPGTDIGVCTDVVIRAYRAVGVDLQKLVHQDIRQNFDAYALSRVYGQKKPDANIDHRRVTNLVTFFRRHGRTLSKSVKRKDIDRWKPGDIVIFDLKGNGGSSHIGIVSNRKSGNGYPLVFHHLPPHPSEDDAIETITVSGHYRY
jgi:uncharacterized protein YijF (DUF1287 family)